MKVVPLSEAKDRLSALVDEAVTTHEVVQITRHGRPAALLMSVDDVESLTETIAWLSRPGTLDDVDVADQEIAAGATFGADRLRTLRGKTTGEDKPPA